MIRQIKIIEDSGSIEFTNNKTMILFLLAITFSCYFFISSATTSKRLKTPDISLTSLLEVNPFIKSDRSIKASNSCSVKTENNKQKVLITLHFNSIIRNYRFTSMLNVNLRWLILWVNLIKRFKF